MKRLMEILKANGIEIPEDKQADVKKALSENYKATEEYNKRVERLERERDGYKEQLETANATLQGFDGLDPEKVKAQLADYKKKAEDAEKNFASQLAARDQKDWLKAKLDEYGVQSPYARKQLMAECMSAESGLKWKGTETGFFGFDDFMKAAKASDSTLYQTAEEKTAAEAASKAAAETAAAAKNAPKFTAATGEAAPSGSKFVPPKIF